MSYEQIGDDAAKEALKQIQAGLPKPNVATIREQMKKGTYVSPLPTSPSASSSSGGGGGGGPPIGLAVGGLTAVAVVGFLLWKKSKGRSA